MKYTGLFLIFLQCATFLSCAAESNNPIDRKALVTRNSPHVRNFDPLSSLSVGNGNFAYTVDATGMQTFPELYTEGVPLGTQSQWGWHSFPNPGYRLEESMKTYNFRGWAEPYATQFNEEGRAHDAAEWFRVNPHRLHLGIIGLEVSKPNGEQERVEAVTDVDQRLDLWTGVIHSSFKLQGNATSVSTVCDPDNDALSFNIHSALFSKNGLSVKFRFPYPSGKHTDDACDWTQPGKHTTELLASGQNYCILKRQIDTTVYYLAIRWKGKARVSKKDAHYFLLSPLSDDFSFSTTFSQRMPEKNTIERDVFAASSAYWNQFWKKGGIVDFSACSDPRAKELERRVVLSQYLLAIQSAGIYPPQETGLTYNSWFGKFHLEMHWWHAAQFALWQRPELLERSMPWYTRVYPQAEAIAKRQGFKGIRWMKMTDPSGIESPSKVGSFLAWQQPHYIYLAELIYRDKPDAQTLKKYSFLVEQTATFMASFATYDKEKNRYVLKGLIPAQETLKASETINPPFELSYWHFAMNLAQEWRQREGKDRNPQWDELIEKLSPLAYNADKLYLAAEDAVDTYKDIRFTSDHMAVLGAVGILPMNKLIREDYMKNTLHWIWDNWNWNKTWGWDYPMTAMNAARMGEPEKAVGALLMDKRTNTYLVNGHNYQDERLRVYLPGNGGLLAAVAMMCAGWDGSKGDAPGFPKDGHWNVRWENLSPMP